MKMIVAKCPLRISLVGGSTDLDNFLKEYQEGSVISFPCNLYTYITLHVNNRKKYIINYTKNEEFVDFNNIDNDVVRVVFKHYETELRGLPTITISFKSDIYSVGSGLAASSSYLIALLKAVSMYIGVNLSDTDICALAISLEKSFNPLTGMQDAYGCGISGFKRMKFRLNKTPEHTFYDSGMLKHYDMWLLHTGVSRSSTNILRSVDSHKSYDLLIYVSSMDECISDKYHPDFISAINDSWEIKKHTSKDIMNKEMVLIEKDINGTLDKSREAFKLCGAGGGGYFLIFRDATKEESCSFRDLRSQYNMTQIHLDSDGLTGVVI